jgi:BirA family biotin operon repressor/biotin-[acetyl-CoA-carboxylase] ligase
LSCNKKIGGILIENTFKNNKLTNSILGFGLNVNQSNFSKFPHAASLFSLTKKNWNIEKVFEALIYALEQDEFINLVKHREANLETFNSYLWRKGKPSKFQGVQSVFEAIPLEVTKQGGLVITSLENEQKKELALANARILYTQN